MPWNSGTEFIDENTYPSSLPAQLGPNRLHEAKDTDSEAHEHTNEQAGDADTMPDKHDTINESTHEITKEIDLTI